MSPAFTDRAARLAGLAGVIAHWPPEQFWRATPAELESLLVALAGGGAMPAPPSPAKIAALKELHPDG